MFIGWVYLWPSSLLSLSTRVQIDGPSELKPKEIELLKDALSISQLNSEPHSREDIERLYGLSQKELKLKLLSLGYLVEDFKSTFQTGKEQVEIRFKIKKTKRLRVLKQDVQINHRTIKSTDPKIQLPFKTGEQLNLNVYEQFKETLLQKYIQEGYLQSFFSKHEILINEKQGSVGIAIHLETGPRYYFGDIHFESKKYSNQDLQKFIPFPAHALYTQKNILKLQNNLSNLQLFSKVHAVPKLDQAHDHQIPIHVKLSEFPSNRYLLGLGYGTDSGMRSSLAWEKLRQNHPGHRVLSEFNLSEKSSKAVVNYIIPGQKASRNRFEVLNKVFRETFDTKTHRSFEQEIRYLKKKGKISSCLSLHYLNERYRVDKFYSQQHTSLLLSGINVSWRKVEKSQGNVFNGFKFGINTKMALRHFCSSFNFFQAEFNTYWIKSFAQNFKLKIRQTTGLSHAPHIDKLPLSLRFFAGGNTSLRGYGYKTLGPSIINPEGKKIVIGGKSLMFNSIELEKEIKYPLSLAVFFDNGNAFQHFGDQFKNSLGIGLRCKTPLAPLRLDLGFPLERQPKRRFKLHLNFGVEM